MSEWQPIETAPERGEFLAWHEGFGEVRTVRRFDINRRPGTVINGPSGAFFRAEWWMPLPDAPK